MSKHNKYPEKDFIIIKTRKKANKLLKQWKESSAVKAIDKLVQLRLVDRIQVMKENKNGMMTMKNNHYLILPFDDAWEFFINNGVRH